MAEAAEAALQSAAATEAQARATARERQRDAHAARDQHEAAERERNRHAARLSALSEGRTRLSANRDEATAAKTEAERTLGALAPAADLETRLSGVRDDIAGKRARLAEARAEQQAIVREAELADRRLTQLATDKDGWLQRQDGARNQIATLASRVAEATRDRAGWKTPQLFASAAR